MCICSITTIMNDDTILTVATMILVLVLLMLLCHSCNMYVYNIV